METNSLTNKEINTFFVIASGLLAIQLATNVFNLVQTRKYNAAYKLKKNEEEENM